MERAKVGHVWRAIQGGAVLEDTTRTVNHAECFQLGMVWQVPSLDGFDDGWAWETHAGPGGRAETEDEARAKVCAALDALERGNALPGFTSDAAGDVAWRAFLDATKGS